MKKAKTSTLWTRALYFVLILSLLSSCYSYPDTDELSYDLVVATDYDTEADFTGYQTYFISDTIIKISGDRNDSIIVGQTALTLINQIKANMSEKGYTFVAQDQNPDLGLIASVIENSNLGTTCSGWWWGYPGYYPPGWWGWPSYGYWYPFCSYYQYDTGSFNMEMFDLKNVEENQRIQGLWNSVSFGVLSSYDQTNINMTLNAIDQAFEQSPYLQK